MKRRNSRYTVAVTARLCADQYERIKRWADDEHLPISILIRKVLFDAVLNHERRKNDPQNGPK